MERVYALARAKVNLVLDVTGKYADGYHSIETVMQSVDLSDELVFTATGYNGDCGGTGYRCDYGGANCRGGCDGWRDVGAGWPDGAGIEVVCDDPKVPSDSSNLVVRAAMRLKELALAGGSRADGRPGGVRIEIHKRIPVAAGLAGGSADAAATLIALNALWGLGLSRDELLRVGASVGADVPFCMIGGTCIARGRGDEVVPLAGMPEVIFILLTSDVGLSTREIYQTYDACELEGWTCGEYPTRGEENPNGLSRRGTGRPLSSGRVADMVTAVKDGELRAIGRFLYNALEPVATNKMPAIRQARQILAEAGALGVTMSGSGPAVFGIFDPRDLVLTDGEARQGQEGAGGKDTSTVSAGPNPGEAWGKGPGTGGLAAGGLVAA
ncbi:MAG TPA: 4-(cytidine 5'-diphospho)-2-C-methyl-D-erythritol kinase, partial [Firmicutes bacterium]|nr:4-(cytidine 5'-diphospho)-2-C-methyl-D-erythritol kinase [Bacillota bacterium]